MANFGRTNIVDDCRQFKMPATMGKQSTSRRQIDHTAILLLAVSAIVTLAGHFLYDELVQALQAALQGVASILGRWAR